MDINKLKDKRLVDVKAIAKAMGLKNVSKYNKAQLIDLIIDGNMSGEDLKPLPDHVVMEAEPKEEKPVEQKSNMKFDLEEDEDENEKREILERNEAEGVLEISDNGFGFLRFSNFMTSELDVYVAPSQIKRFRMRTGDKIQGNVRKPKRGEKFRALVRVTKINQMHPEMARKRGRFDKLTPMYPDERFRLEGKGGDLAMRLIDMIAPIGKGQRGLIVAPPKAGKTMLLQKIAKQITANYPEVEVIVLLIDERPEEVTEMQRSIDADVIYSTFDQLPSHHIKVAEMVISRAKALVEQKKDVVILLDSITRLARAYNLEVPTSGRTLSGGLDPSALHRPKRFLGAARNVEEGGSLTILATALIETGSRMDDVIFEEFKGTGNMELTLSRKLSERRIFPAIDVNKSGTRRDELLLSDDELEIMRNFRQDYGSSQNNMTEVMINRILKTKTNEEFVKKFKK